MAQFLVETITITGPTGKTNVITRSQEIPQAADTLLGFAKALGLEEQINGTYSVKVSNTDPTATPNA